MDFENPPADPVAALRRWLDEAAAESGLPNPTAMSLATVGPDGKPASRMMLLKGLDERGVEFYTNRTSRKAQELRENHAAALLIHWDPLMRQVRIEGRVSLVSDEESDAYFATRERGSQLGAWASRQSHPIESRAALDAAFAEMEQRFQGQDVPRPPFWGGYRVSLERIEFWQGHAFRLHDRVVYTSDGRGGWTTQRLCP